MPGKVYVFSPGTLLYKEKEKQKTAQLDKTELIMSRKALETIFSGIAAGRNIPGYMRYLQKGDYAGIANAYLCFGGDELFSAAAESICNRMEECSVNVTLEISKGMYHCYSVMPLVPETQDGYQRMIDYLKYKYKSTYKFPITKYCAKNIVDSIAMLKYFPYFILQSYPLGKIPPIYKLIPFPAV